MKPCKVARSLRRLAMLAAIMGTTTFQTQGCLTQEAREALLIGLQGTFNSFVTTMIDTFFLQITSQPTTPDMDTVI